MTAALASARRARAWRLGPVLCLALLAACGSVPRGGANDTAGDSQRDGPPANPPADLAERPDATPRVEAIRSGGPNKPYVVLGQAYTPVAGDEPMVEAGLASWYGRKFHGKPTASGELFDMYAMTAAHRTMPIPSYALVRNPANGREVVVRINDRGPFHPERVIDLSYAAALKLGTLRGLTPVQVQRLTHDDIRTERWRADPLSQQATAAASPMAASADVTQTSPAGPAPPPAATTQVAAAADIPPPAAGTTGYWLQLGAFRQRQGANDLRQQLQRELAWLGPWLAVFDDSALFRVQAGPFVSHAEATGAAERIRAAARIQPLVVMRR